MRNVLCNVFETLENNICAMNIEHSFKAKSFLRSKVLHHYFSLPKVQVQNGNEVLTQQGSFMSQMHGTSLLSTPG